MTIEEKTEDKKMAIYELHAQENMNFDDSVKAEVIHQIGLSSQIPEDAKQAVKDFVNQAWDQILSDTVSNVPDAISDYLDIIMEIVSRAQ